MSILDELKSLDGKFITIGIHGDDGSQKKIVRTLSAQTNLKNVKDKFKSTNGKLERHRTDQNLTVAQVAIWNEFGTKNIPARPFVESVLINDHQKILNVAKRWLSYDPSSFFDELGTFIVNQIKLNISKKIFAPNAKSTIARKGSSTPLIDFGQLRASLTYKVHNND